MTRFTKCRLLFAILTFLISMQRRGLEYYTVIAICLPTKHLGVLMDSFKRVRAFQIELEFESVGF